MARITSNNLAIYAFVIRRIAAVKTVMVAEFKNHDACIRISANRFTCFFCERFCIVTDDSTEGNEVHGDRSLQEPSPREEK